MERTRYKGRPYRGWRDDVEDDLNIMGIKYRQVMVGDCWKWKKMVLKAKVNEL